MEVNGLRGLTLERSVVYGKVSTSLMSPVQYILTPFIHSYDLTDRLFRYFYTPSKT